MIFGAAGHTGKYLTRKMQSVADIELSVFVSNPAKFGDMDMTGVNVMQGDALNAEDVCCAMGGQDVLLCSLEGDVLAMAKNIAAALEKTSVKRIIWITGMGIHHEIRGIHGIMLNQLAKKMPEYIQAADTIWPGTLLGHVRYEKALHPVFAAFLRTEPAASAACFDEASLYEACANAEHSMETDCRFIFAACSSLLRQEPERIPAEAVQPDIFEAQTRVWNVYF